MINLAYSYPTISQIIKVNNIIKQELDIANIDVVCNFNMIEHSEIPTHITGKLYNFTFERYWKYWVVEGFIPLELAQEIYNTDIGKKYIRAGGHGEGLPPETQTKLINAFNKRYIIDDDKFEKYCDDCKEAPNVVKDIQEKFIKRSECFEYDIKSYILSYHIDTQEALTSFSKILRDYVTKTTEEKIWGNLKPVTRNVLN